MFQVELFDFFILLDDIQLGKLILVYWVIDLDQKGVQQHVEGVSGQGQFL